MIIACHHRGWEGERQPHYAPATVELTVRREHADDPVIFSIQRDLAADDVRIPAKPAPPNAVREHGFAIVANLAFAFDEGASQRRAHTKHLEIRCRDSVYLELL